MVTKNRIPSVLKAFSSVTKKFSAFTLVELIVVITILAILATIGFLALSGYTQDAKDASVKANVRSVMTAISSESAVTNNSPRYYVVHDTGAALSDGSVAYVDGNPTFLTGGAYGTANTNYSAGNPDWVKLKLNPDKFRLSVNGLQDEASVLIARVTGFGTVDAAYDSASISVWAMDAALVPTANGRNRTASFFQISGIAPATKTVSISGNFPAPTATEVSSGAVRGLLKSPSSTWALVDGGTSGGLSSSSNSSGDPAAFVPAKSPAYASWDSFIFALPSGTTVTVTVTGAGAWTVAGTKSLHSPACSEDDIAIWGTTGNPQVWAACNVGATAAMPYANMKFDGTTADSGVYDSTYAGGIYQWGNNTNVRSVGTWATPAITNDSWGNTTNTNDARQGPCPSGYHVPNGGMNAAGSTYTAANNEWNTAYVIASSAWAGTSCDPATIINQHRRLRCLLRLPRSGSRNQSNGSWSDQGSYGFFWSSSPKLPSWLAQYAVFSSSGGNIAYDANNTPTGHSVRCIKN